MTQTADSSLCWKVPNRKISINLSAHLLTGISNDIKTRRESACGLLLGFSEGDEQTQRRISAESCLPLDGVETDSLSDRIQPFQDIIDVWLSKPEFPKPLGLYAFDSNGLKGLARSFSELRPYLRDQTAVLMATNVGDSEIGADMSVVASGNAISASEHLILSARPVERTPQPSPAPSKPPARPPVQAAVAHVRPVRWSGRITGLSVAILLLVVTAAGTAYFGNFRYSPVSPPVASAAPAFALQIDRKGEELTVTWDQGSEIISRANRGFLYITDGAYSTQMFLDAAQLRTGRIFYRTRTPDTTIQLEVVTPDNRLIGQSVRVLQPAASATVAFSAPAPAQTSRAASSTSQREGTQDANTRRASDVFRLPDVKADRTTAQDTQPILLAGPQLTHLPSSPAAVVPGLPNPAGIPGPPPSDTTPALNRSGIAPPITPARPIRQTPVVLPQVLRALIRKPLTVQLMLGLDETGRVTGVTPQQGLGAFESQLARFAAATVRNWRFSPAVRGAVPVPSEFQLVFQFRP